VSAVIDRHPEVERYSRSVPVGDLLALADAGGIAIVEEQDSRPAAAMVTLGRLRHMLARLIEPHLPMTTHENDKWFVRLPGLPIATEARSFDDAIADLIEAMNDYAGDWADHLYSAPNHKANDLFAHFVQLSDDNQLREWLFSAER
jgi:hypothetical protein